ncbi:MAG: Uma2 family endonuclease [Spirulina sp.]
MQVAATTDRLAPLQAKLREYQANGCQLGWLINVQDRQVEVYRADQPPERLDAPPTLYGEAMLPGLTVNTAELC